MEKCQNLSASQRLCLFSWLPGEAPRYFCLCSASGELRQGSEGRKHPLLLHCLCARMRHWGRHPCEHPCLHPSGLSAASPSPHAMGFAEAERPAFVCVCVCVHVVRVHTRGLAQSHRYRHRVQQQLSPLLLPPAIAFTLAEALQGLVLQGVLLLPGLTARCGEERIFLRCESSHHCRWCGSRARFRA